MQLFVYTCSNDCCLAPLFLEPCDCPKVGRIVSLAEPSDADAGLDGERA